MIFFEKILKSINICYFLLFSVNYAWSVVELPTDIDPIQIEKQFKPDFNKDKSKVIIEQIPTSQMKLPPEYYTKNILLNKIDLIGNDTLPDKNFTSYYEHLYGQKISLATLYLVAEQIANKYRALGYSFSTALIPEQKISNGTVSIAIIEGYVNHISVIGNPKENTIINTIIDKIYAIKPFNIHKFERYILLLNELPGLQIKAVFKKSESSNLSAGGVDIDLVSTKLKSRFSANISNNIANYLGNFITSFQMETANILFNNHSTMFNISVVDQIKPLQLFNFFEKIILNSEGTSLVFNSDITRVKPMIIQNSVSLKIISTSTSFQVLHPLLRGRVKNLTTFVGFSANNSRTEIASFLNNKDKIRSVNFGANYDFYDSFNGINLLTLKFLKGLDILDSSKRLAYPSKEYGQVDFFKTIFSLSHQQILARSFSLYTAVDTQYTKNILLSSETFSFGGNNVGRGYNSSALSGDKGYSIVNELRYGLPRLAFLDLELFVFHDYGRSWNRHKPLIKNVKAISRGTGLRFNIGAHSSGQLTIARPLTRKVFLESNYKSRRPTQITFSLYFRM